MDISRKIYLSKSNLAYSEDIKDVKEYLQRMGYEIIEHNGGEYDKNLLKQAETFIMVGYDMDSTTTTRNVGRGQYDQLQARGNAELDENYYYTGNDKLGQPTFLWVETMGIINSDSWKQDYGEVILEEDDSWCPVSGPAPRDAQGNKSASDIVDDLEEEFQEQLKETVDVNGVHWKSSPQPTVEYNSNHVHLAAIALFK